MSATVIPLQRRSKSPLKNVRIDAIGTMPANDGASVPIDAMQVKSILLDLRARQDTLLSVIEGLRAPSLRAHPKLGPIAESLDTTSAQALVEVELLIRHSTALLNAYQGTK